MIILKTSIGNNNKCINNSPLRRVVALKMRAYGPSPTDVTAVTLTLYDAHSWRSTASNSVSFVTPDNVLLPSKRFSW